ncbi:MAG: hypothetical protein ABI821_12360 [Pseudomonadota bacterium]
MDRRIGWIAIVVVLALTVVTAANCRQIPHPWEPTAAGSAPEPR